MGQHAAPDHLCIGTTQIIPHDGGPITEYDLVCCIHCGYTWAWQPGSGRIRGWCMTCNGLLCGRKFCREQVPCRHWLHGIDQMEAGLPETAEKKIIVPASF